MDKNEIEKIFRSSNSSNELFDAFAAGLQNNINDTGIYKILLGNPALSEDELLMYTEKLADELPANCYEIYSWTAGVLGSKTFDTGCLEKSIKYYAKATQKNKTDHIPYIKALNLYNYDMSTTLNNTIINFIEQGIPTVNYKSKVYSALAEHYKRTGNSEAHAKCSKLAEQSAQRES